jgi:hypothetical protein
MKAALAIIGVVIILILFGTMMSGINDAQTLERTDTFVGVVTGGGITEADVVLVADPFNNSILSVTSLTSNEVLDGPLPDSYVTGTNTLTVRGLNASDTRTLTVVYDYGSLTGSVGTFLGMIPIFVAIAAVLIIIGAGIAVFASRRG